MNQIPVLTIEDVASLDGVLGGDVWNSGVVRIDMTNGIFAVRRPQPD